MVHETVNCRWRYASNEQEKAETVIIDGSGHAKRVRVEVKRQVEELHRNYGAVPKLAVVTVGANKSSQAYQRMKQRAASECGILTVDVHLPEDVLQEDLLAKVEMLNADPIVHAILIQLPLPKHIDEGIVVRSVSFEKDVDGSSSENISNLVKRGGLPPVSVPCTAAACIELLRWSGVAVEGKDAVVIGRSNLVGMPVAALLQSMNATVTVCHTATKTIKEKVKHADILVVAAGRAEMVRGDWLKPGCVVIDVGINYVVDVTKRSGCRLVGDVNFEEAKTVASFLTPVPGGVGPMTVAMLLVNTVQLVRHSLNLPFIDLCGQLQTTMT